VLDLSLGAVARSAGLSVYWCGSLKAAQRKPVILLVPVFLLDDNKTSTKGKLFVVNVLKFINNKTIKYLLPPFPGQCVHS